jgi:hypothetical protein
MVIDGVPTAHNLFQVRDVILLQTIADEEKVKAGVIPLGNIT